MSYIGNGPPLLAQYGVESFNGGGTSFTLSKPAATATVLVFIDGVRQTPTDAYSVSGVTLTTTATTPSGTDNVTVQFLGDVVDFGEPSDDSVSTAKIQDDAVTAAKLANSINTEITANTAKVTNATHTGDVTGATALTIATDAVDIAMLSATGVADATTFLRGDNAWAAAGGDNTPAFQARNYSTTESISNTTWADTSHTLTANITSASNKVIVLVSTTARIYRPIVDDTQGFWRIQNTTDASTLTETMLWYGSNTSWDKKFAVANTLVGVETGISGSKTYTVQFKSDSTGGTTFYLNYNDFTGCMILLEVE